MRVCHLFHLYLPRTMNWAYRLIQYTPDVEVSIAARWKVQNEYSDSDFQFFLNPVQSLFRCTPTDEWQYPNLRRVIVGLSKYSGWYAAALEQHICQWKPDVLHAHFGPVGIEHMDLAEKHGIPLIVSFYGYDLSYLPTVQPSYREQYKRLFEVATRVVAAGHTSAATLRQLGCPTEKIAVVSLSIDLNQFPYQPRVKQPNRLDLGQIASFSEKKGHIYTLQAFRAALSMCPDMTLTLGGEVLDASIFRACRQYVTSHKLEQHVHWLGFVAHDQMPSTLADIDVFIQPSFKASDGNMEGPVVANIEAQAIGRPVISTRHGDIPEVVLHELTGLLADERDVEALCAAICRFYQMGNQEYQTFAQNARKHVAAQFDVRKNARLLRAVYE